MLPPWVEVLQWLVDLWLLFTHDAGALEATPTVGEHSGAVLTGRTLAELMAELWQRVAAVAGR